MSKSVTNPQVDAELRNEKKWPKEMAKLRSILLGAGLTEDFKWGSPCYTFQEANVVLILSMKAHCALLFCKGALLKDPDGFLITAGANTQAARQMRFTSLQEIEQRKAALKSYLRQAIEVEKAGLDVVYKKITEVEVPEELQAKLDKNPAFKKAFTALTPGRQRGYIIHISGAKQSATRASRVEKCTPRIMAGKGMQDR